MTTRGAFDIYTAKIRVLISEEGHYRTAEVKARAMDLQHATDIFAAFAQGLKVPEAFHGVTLEGVNLDNRAAAYWISEWLRLRAELTGKPYEGL